MLIILLSGNKFTTSLFLILTLSSIRCVKISCQSNYDKLVVVCNCIYIYNIQYIHNHSQLQAMLLTALGFVACGNEFSDW